MSTAKVAITIEESLLHKLDRLVKSHVFPNRSKAIQEAVSDKLARIDHHRLAKGVRLRLVDGRRDQGANVSDLSAARTAQIRTALWWRQCIPACLHLLATSVRHAASACPEAM